MPRISRYPLTYDSILKLTITELKRIGWLIEGCKATGPLNWTRGGKVTNSITVLTYTKKDFPDGPIGWVTLAYKTNGEVISQDIKLTTVPSNLGRGMFWYFVCPITGERCRTLYLVGNRFASRKAVKGAVYESQIVSKQYRWYDMVYGPGFKLDRLYMQMKRYAKRTYRNKPTPLMRKIQKLEQRERKGLAAGHILDAIPPGKRKAKPTHPTL